MITMPVTNVMTRTRLSPKAKLLLIREILAAYVRVRLWLRRADFRSVLVEARSTEPVYSFDAADRDATVAAARLGRAVALTLTFLPTDTRCLTRSLVLTTLLARRGISSSLVIGVRTEPRFAAHAWVERDGYPLLATTTDYERLLEI